MLQRLPPPNENDSLSTHTTAYQALLQEIELASKFNSERLVRVLGACMADRNNICLVMELVPGVLLIYDNLIPCHSGWGRKGGGPGGRGGGGGGGRFASGLLAGCAAWQQQSTRGSSRRTCNKRLMMVSSQVCCSFPDAEDFKHYGNFCLSPSAGF